MSSVDVRARDSTGVFVYLERLGRCLEGLQYNGLKLVEDDR